MYSVFRKEISSFLGSLTGYLVILVFLLVTGLFLWVFPGQYNIPENGYATLDGLFLLAPWLYLFLIPAITMRFFADEKRTGTIETLLVRPVSDLQLVFAKFLAGLVLVVISLLPTLLYFLSVYLLGNPVGSIDTGATWGAFIGLFFLAAIYISIGIFASSLTDNQIISFIVAMAVSFVFYLGFEFAASAGVPFLIEQLLTWLSINSHYLSVSRGVADMRDLLYFIGITLFFLVLTSTLLRPGNWKMKKTKLQFAIFTVVLFVVLFASSNFLFRIDLTADKRFSLAPVSREIAGELNTPVEIELFLEGELEPGLQKIQQEIFEKIAVLNVYASSPIRLKVSDPYNFRTTEKRDKFQQSLVDKGVKPISFNKRTNQGVSTKYIFPGALIRINGKEIAVNFLKNNPDFSYEMNFNHSVESVEFELVNAFQKLMHEAKSTVGFLQGHGELNRYEVMDFAGSLAGDFNVSQVLASELAGTSKEIDILIVAGPKQPFPESDKFLIDQYLMRGGKIMWLIDPVLVNADSLSSGYQTYAFPVDLNLGDQLFKYGVRLNYELLQDVDCAQLMVNIAPEGSDEQWTRHPWYYSPLLTPADNHPLSRNLNRVFTEFVSSVDTVSGNKELSKTIILTTSPYARRVKSPSSVSLENINNPPARELFTQPFIPVGVLVEGEFTSVFENRMIENLDVQTDGFRSKGTASKMIVIADAGMIANKVDYTRQPPRIREEMGFDRVSRQTFGNREFLLNAVYFLGGYSEIMQLRNRTVQLRLLDKVKLREEKTWWQWFNIVSPMLIILMLGIGYNALRRTRYKRLIKH
ncbi:MAG TPA: gliding motility-associated ABC transporter substrate-binding protein GldG [Prolixibacteraceae bacterium]|nr:gliding motility-associated ABC transporter substrate-binding protein GldG [Prolixibacteraceae bacterium]